MLCSLDAKKMTNYILLVIWVFFITWIISRYWKRNAFFEPCHDRTALNPYCTASLPVSDSWEKQLLMQKTLGQIFPCNFIVMVMHLLSFISMYVDLIRNSVATTVNAITVGIFRVIGKDDLWQPIHSYYCRFCSHHLQTVPASFTKADEECNCRYVRLIEKESRKWHLRK